MMPTKDVVPFSSGSLVPKMPSDGITWERLPVVVDSSTLIADCLRYARIGNEPLLLGLAQRLPVVNLYATESVRLEVEEHLSSAAEDVRLAPELVGRIWHEKLAPVINFVDLDALPSRDSRVARLASVDPDDAPTGSLAEILGPCLVFSSDPHLIDAGIARKDWGNLLTRAREVGIYQLGTSGATITTAIILGVGLEIGAALGATARRYPLPTLVIGLAGAYLICSYWRSDSGVSHRGEGLTALTAGGKRLGAFLLRANECQALLEQAAFVPEADPGPGAAVARVLAAAPQPLWPAEIAARVGLSHQKVTAILRQLIFTRIPDQGYVLGRRVFSSDCVDQSALPASVAREGL